MYKIIGADGVQYGPIPLEQLKQWIAEGRVNAQTLVQPDGSTDWNPLSAHPDLSALVTPLPPPSPTAIYPQRPQDIDAEREVQGPAIGLLVTAALGLAGTLGHLGLSVFGISIGPHHGHRGDGAEYVINLVAGGAGIAGSLVQIATGIVIIIGALKMMRLQNYSLCFVSAILAMVPCTSPCCCLISLPIGIWALILLTKPEIKSAFY